MELSIHTKTTTDKEMVENNEKQRENNRRLLDVQGEIE